MALIFLPASHPPSQRDLVSAQAMGQLLLCQTHDAARGNEELAKSPGMSMIRDVSPHIEAVEDDRRLFGRFPSTQLRAGRAGPEGEENVDTHHLAAATLY